MDLYKDGKRKSYHTHRLVAEAFIPNPKNKPEVNHKDENKDNNCIDNLNWVTHSENSNWGSRMDRIVKALSKPIYAINIKTNERIDFPSIGEAGRNGFNQSSIIHCLKCRQKVHKGYIWFYFEK